MSSFMEKVDFYEQKTQSQASKAETAREFKISDFAVASGTFWPEKQKADAYDKIKTSTDNINEIANRLIKEARKEDYGR